MEIKTINSIGHAKKFAVRHNEISHVRNSFNQTVADSFSKTSLSSIGNQPSFGAQNSNDTYMLFPTAMEPKRDTVDAKFAIRTFDLFKNGNYLSPDLKREVIKTNLSFLDCIKSPQEKKKFINHYKEITGFPSLDKVSQKIEDAFQNAAKKTVIEMEQSGGYSRYPYAAKISGMGYDGVCSVGKNAALPGSDINNAYIILKGHNGMNHVKQRELLEDFKKLLVKNTDHRLLSYNRHKYSMPLVTTESILSTRNDYYNTLFEKAYTLDTFMGLIPFFNALMIKNIEKTLSESDDAMQKYNPDYRAANIFFETMMNYEKYEKNLYFDHGLLLESIAKGKKFLKYNHPSFTEEFLPAYYTNLSQINALSKTKKPVIELHRKRNAFAPNFNNLDVDTQYELVKSMIKASARNYYKQSDIFNNNSDDIYENLKIAGGISD